MDINATIIGQFITFAILIWFVMKYVWVPVTAAMHAREKKISAGLEAAERSKRELEMAEHKSLLIMKDAKQQATHIIEQANLHSAKLIEDAKGQAKQEGQRIIDLAHGEINREVAQVKEQLKVQVATLAIASAEKIMQQHLDSAIHQDLLKQVITDI